MKGFPCFVIFLLFLFRPKMLSRISEIKYWAIPSDAMYSRVFSWTCTYNNNKKLRCNIKMKYIRTYVCVYFVMIFITAYNLSRKISHCYFNKRLFRFARYVRIRKILEAERIRGPIFPHEWKIPLLITLCAPRLYGVFS